MSVTTSQETNILLLEDDEIDQLTILKIVNKHLRRSNMLIINSISEFNSFLKNGELLDIDLIIMDLSLPDGDALTKIKAVASAYKSLKIIVISGQDDIKVAMKALEYGANSYIIKGKNFGIDFLSSLNSSVMQIRLEKLILKYTDFIFKPENFPTAVFSISDNGPFVHLRDFDTLPLSSELDIEFYLLNMAVISITAIGQGHKYSEGIFELPVHDLPDYKSLMFSKVITDKESNDIRLNVKSIVIFCIFIPKDIKGAMPEMTKFETQILSNFEDGTDISQIDMQFLKKRKSEFLNIIKLNFSLGK